MSKSMSKLRANGVASAEIGCMDRDGQDQALRSWRLWSVTLGNKGDPGNAGSLALQVSSTTPGADHCRKHILEREPFQESFLQISWYHLRKACLLARERVSGGNDEIICS